VGRARVLGSEEFVPGEEGWLQLELSQPVVTTRGDRYILRRPSPGETIGGGAVIDPHPKGRHKRFAAETLERLDALSQGDSSDVLLQALLALGAAPLKDVVARSNLASPLAQQAIETLQSAGQLLNLEPNGTGSPDDLVTHRGLWEQVSGRATEEVGAYHKAYPLRRGMPREELKSRLKDVTRPSARLFNAALRRLVQQARLQESGPLVFLPDHQVRFSPALQQRVDRLMQRFAEAPYAPPSLKDCQAEIGEETVAARVVLGQLGAVAPDVLFRQVDYERMVADVRRLIQQNGSLTVAQARDHFNTSRRYILAFLEHLDATGVTLRQGDDRKLRK